MSDKDKNLLLDVSADVWEGRVLLTGTLDSRKTRREVLSLVRRDKRNGSASSTMRSGLLQRRRKNE